MKFYVKSHLSENISKTPEGFLLCRNVILTHTGPLRYQKGEHPFDDENEVIMSRDPKELFSLQTMSSFEGKDITIQHPDDFVSPENYKELTNGVMFGLRKHKEKVEVEGELYDALACDMLIKSDEAIELVENGEREVSLGYDAFWELTGEGEGKHSKIIGNHCAIVESGRAGKYCAINDAKEKAMKVEKETQTILDRVKKVFGKSLDEAEAEKEKESKDEQADLKKKVADLEEKLSKKEESKDEEEGEEGSAASKRLDAIESKLEKLMELIAAKNSSEDEDEEAETVEDDEDEDEENEEETSDGEEGSEAMDEDEEEKKDKKSNDSLSRAEILSPGIKKSKDMKAKALAAAFKTADGKKIISKLIGKKTLDKLNETEVNAVFNAAAEMMKAKRTKDHASQRVMTIDSFPQLKGDGVKTANDINKMNAEFYGNKK